MDRVQLEEYIAAGMSLVQIGALLNRDPSTVGYWVHKYGLVANGREKYAPRGGLTREQLEPLAESGASLREMAEALDRNQSTICYWLRKLNVQAGGGRNGGRRAMRRPLD